MRQIMFVTIFGCLLFAGIVAFGEAPTAPVNNVVKPADQAIDSQYNSGTGTPEAISSVIATMTDTCNLVIKATGFAWLGPKQALYLTCSDSTNALYDKGWQYVKNDIRSPKRIRIPFTFWWYDSLVTQTDLTDTFYIGGAVAGSTSWETVTIEDLLITFDILDRN